MRQWMRRTTAGVLAAAALTGMAGAANFTHCADALKNMGLFIGTQNGYELDRTPTRAEAAIMLVRLLGEEDAAKADTYDTPFTDVPDWAAPYVGWLYENQLTMGVSSTKFGTRDTCSAQQYATFLLRALGYEDGNGYTYKTALDYAKTLGVVDAVNCDTDNFLRDHVVAMSYTALSRPTEDGIDMLLESLIQQGSVSERKASDTLTLFQSCQAYDAVRRQSAKMGARTYDLTATITDNAYNQISCSGTLTVDGQDLSAELRQGDTLILGLYQKNGTLYRYENGKTVKASSPVSLGAADARMPVSAVTGLTAQNGRYAFSFAPGVLNELVSAQNTTLKQVDYSATTQNGIFGQQTGRIYVTMPVNGRTSTYAIELNAVLRSQGGSVQVPDGMDV